MLHPWNAIEQSSLTWFRLFCNNKRLILVYFLVLFACVSGFVRAHTAPENGVKHQITHFLKLLKKDYSPTLKDYQWTMGYSDFAELQFFWKHCAKTPNAAPLRDRACYNELVDNWVKKDKSPSYYLRWLQRQLPKNPKVSIQHSEVVKQEQKVLGTQVRAKLNNRSVTFWIPNLKAHLKKYGHIQITHIQGVPIQILRQQSYDGSVLAALGMKVIVRPLTQAESDHLKKLDVAECKADPECAKDMLQVQREHAIEEKEMKQSQEISKKYKTWCAKNSKLCKEENQKKKNSMEEMRALNKACSQGDSDCTKKVAKWHRKQKALTNSFCISHKQECKQLEKIRQARLSRSRAYCKENPKQCAAGDSKFDQALQAARAQEP